MHKYNYSIKGNERRKCCVEGCEWWDRDKRYGVYFPDGKYYCSKHGREVGIEGLQITKNKLEMEKI
jgi:hypothetical protein